MIGDRIKEIRKQKGLSLRRLAQMANIAVSHLNEIEKNNVAPGTTTLEKLANALDIKQEDFFKEGQEDNEVDLFVTKLVNELLKEGIINDPDNIPDEVVDMVIAALKNDIRRIKKGTKLI